MTSFGWKRKLGEKICRDKAQKFSSESKDDNEEEEIDWTRPAPAKKALLIEDRHSKSERLKKEGIVLAEVERFWEAINKWNEAIQLTPDNGTLMEMKAQALMSVGEVLPAVQAAQKAVEMVPGWWVAHQTLGRALTNIGEVKMALRSFSCAIHLKPNEKELWNEDLLWTQSLLAGKEVASNTTTTNTKRPTVTVQELREEQSSSTQDTEEIDNENKQLVSYSKVMDVDLEEEDPVEASLVQIPANYVHMRDLS